MDYIREFDIKLDKEYYYAGEQLNGTVILETTENFKLKSKSIGDCRLFSIKKNSKQFLAAIRVILRGKAHAEWKVMLSGDRRTVSLSFYY